MTALPSSPHPSTRRTASGVREPRLEPVNYDPCNIRREFSRVARRLPGGGCLYDLLMGYWERSADRLLVTRMSPLPRGARVLELGVGTGYLTSLLERRHPDSQIIGLDLSDEMLGVAREAIEARARTARPRRSGCPPTAGRAHPTVLRLRDVVRDGLEPADCVVSSFLLDLLDERSLLELLAHIHRALPPGGRAHLLALTTEHGRRWQPLGRPGRFWYDRTVRGYLACYRSRVLRHLSHRLLDYYTHCRPIPLRRLIVGSGLFRIAHLRLAAIKVMGIPLLPAQIVEIVPR